MRSCDGSTERMVTLLSSGAIGTSIKAHRWAPPLLYPMILPSHMYMRAR